MTGVIDPSEPRRRSYEKLALTLALAFTLAAADAEVGALRPLFETAIADGAAFSSSEADRHYAKRFGERLLLRALGDRSVPEGQVTQRLGILRDLGYAQDMSTRANAEL